MTAKKVKVRTAYPVVHVTEDSEAMEAEAIRKSAVIGDEREIVASRVCYRNPDGTAREVQYTVQSREVVAEKEMVTE